MPSSSQSYTCTFLYLFQTISNKYSTKNVILFFNDFYNYHKNFVMATVHKKMTICRLLIRHDRETLRHNGFITGVN